MKWKYIIEISTYSHLNINVYIKIYVKCLDSTNVTKFYCWKTSYSCVIIRIRTKLKASYNRVKTLPNDVLLNKYYNKPYISTEESSM